MFNITDVIHSKVACRCTKCVTKSQTLGGGANRRTTPAEEMETSTETEEMIVAKKNSTSFIREYFGYGRDDTGIVHHLSGFALLKAPVTPAGATLFSVPRHINYAEHEERLLLVSSLTHFWHKMFQHNIFHYQSCLEHVALFCLSAAGRRLPQRVGAL